VLVVDDHVTIRDGLRMYLEIFDDIEVVGDAADGSASRPRYGWPTAAVTRRSWCGSRRPRRRPPVDDSRTRYGCPPRGTPGSRHVRLGAA
jgi:hypothetical protein